MSLVSIAQQQFIPFVPICAQICICNLICICMHFPSRTVHKLIGSFKNSVTINLPETVENYPLKDYIDSAYYPDDLKTLRSHRDK